MSDAQQELDERLRVLERVDPNMATILRLTSGLWWRITCPLPDGSETWATYDLVAGRKLCSGFSTPWRRDDLGEA